MPGESTDASRPHDEPEPEATEGAPNQREPSAPEAGPIVPAALEPAPGRPAFVRTLGQWVRDYFLGDDPSFGIAVVPYCFLALVLFVRHPSTNYIFDEQEALLANPFVRSIADVQAKFRWRDAFYRDFWGLGPDRSIGSYRPIPNLVWRALWGLGAREQQGPFLHHAVNVLLHGANGALVCLLALRLTRDRRTAWLAGACFTASAVLTEAVSGVVGIADGLGATGALAALLGLGLPMPLMGVAVFLATLFGLYSKESALCCVPLVPAFALLTAPLSHPERPRRVARAAVALLATASAFVLYVEARRRMFPTTVAAELSVEANAGKPLLPRTFAALLRWYAQPSLPKDPLNNPLVSASFPYRVAGALRVYFRGILQVLFPHALAGDYSAPQEPVPARLVFPESVLGLLAMVVPAPFAAWAAISNYGRSLRARAAGALAPLDRRPLLGAALLWVAISYFPVSNIPVLLPTVRAERFWYFPVIGTSLTLGIAFDALLRTWARGWRRWGALVAMAIFFAIQAIAARSHANDYKDDLAFWDATRAAVPRSAKAHLNYSVMKGARGDLTTRLESNKVALDLAPSWPMASVYLGDTLCRLHRAEEAWPHYLRGFELAPNDVNLVALGLQCLWDEHMLESGSAVTAELDVVKDRHPGSWLEYLARDILDHGEEHNGVDPKYRPRGYNEGPKE